MRRRRPKRAVLLIVGICGLNLSLVDTSSRLDLTAGQQHTLSPAA